jgi:multicomponent Na+:H+ antiporter subunit G
MDAAFFSQVSVVDLLSWVCLLAGTGFCLVGGIGMVRLPDFYSRVHAASMTDSLGAALILSGLLLQAGVGIVGVKIVMVWAFLWLTSPAASHALAKAAYSRGVRVTTGPSDGDPWGGSSLRESLPGSEPSATGGDANG